MSGPMTTVPVGTILAIYTSASTPPEGGWRLCDGREFDPNAYPDIAGLFPGNRLPDLRGKTIVGASANHPQGDDFGAGEITLSLEQMPSHQHFGWGESSDVSGNGLGFGVSAEAIYLGSGKYDYHNQLYGSSFAGGVGTSGDIQTKRDGAPDTKTGSAPSANRPFSVIQPSFSINYYIYIGREIED